MDKVLKAGIKKYIKQVKALLLCDAKTAKCFLSDFENDIVNYIEDCNVKNINDVIEKFGDPESVARSFLETANIQKIRKRIRIKNIIITAIIVVILMWAGCLTYLFADAVSSHHGHGTETLPIIGEKNVMQVYNNFYNILGGKTI